MKPRLLRWTTAVIVGAALAAFPTWMGTNLARAAGTPMFPAGSRPAGYKLGLLATACWMGGVWSDAEGAPPIAWRDRDEQRCRDLVATVYGRVETARLEQLRGNEEQAVGDLLAKIRATEPVATRDRTVALFRDVAAAAHEGMLARRAADRVKIDYDADAPEAKLTGDQRAAAGALAEHGALDQLLMAADPASADRRVLGLLFALDRMEIARGLPKQLKFYAVGHIFTTTFDAEPPPATALNPNATPQPGTWLTYLTDVALLAGHRVPEGRAITNKVWETLAWTGIGRGFADQLRREAASLPDAAIPELTHVTASVAARLDSERSTAESLSAVHASNELTARQEP